MYQNYITGQTEFVLNYDYDVPENHLVRLISAFVDSIPADVLLEDEVATEENLPMRWLAQDHRYSYHTINNFRRSRHAHNLIKRAFVYFTIALQDQSWLNSKRCVVY